MKAFLLAVLMVIGAALLGAEELQFTAKSGYRFAESTLSLNGNVFRLWIYAPLDETAGRKCVIVPPAGSPLILGMNVGEGDQAEHLPYVKNGHYVVSFDIIGGKSAEATADETLKAIKLFFQAGMGVDQIPLIIGFIKSRLKQVDPKAIYMAGHSSAATLVLQASQKVEGLAGALAFCPIVDIEKRIEVAKQDAIKQLVPRFKGGLSTMNPALGYKKTKCRMFLFGSTGDSLAPLASIEAYAQQLTDAKLNVTLVTGTADHYQSMISEGIPAALMWLSR